MNNYSSETILEEVKNLISNSISNPEIDNSRYESLHRSIIKKYFDARNIQIDYKAQTIDLELPVTKDNFTKLTFECLDLNSFLQSCIKADKQSLHFYQDLLIHHNVVSAA